MSHRVYHRVAGLILALVISACSMGAPPPSPTPIPTLSPTNLPTNTPLPTATNTPIPTETPLPTSTPNLAATQQAEVLQSLLASFQEKGLLQATEGTFKTIPDFKRASANKGYLEDITDTGETTGDHFVFSAHFKWSSAISTPDRNGCGVVFGMQDNEDRYAVFVDREIILFVLKRGTYHYRVGRTNGPSGPKMGTPTDLDFALLVNGHMAYVSLNGTITSYTLSADQTAAGKLALTLLSGTTRDYGTRCEMTNIVVWTPK